MKGLSEKCEHCKADWKKSNITCQSCGHDHFTVVRELPPGQERITTGAMGWLHWALSQERFFRSGVTSIAIRPGKRRKP